LEPLETVNRELLQIVMSGNARGSIQEGD